MLNLEERIAAQWKADKDSIGSLTNYTAHQVIKTGVLVTLPIHTPHIIDSVSISNLIA